MRRDPVTPELREFVMRRDGKCVLAIFDASHQCYDAFGRPHASDDLDKLQLEHVKDRLRMGKRAPSDPLHLLTLCGFRNVIRPPTKIERVLMRQYLQKFVEDVA